MSGELYDRERALRERLNQFLEQDLKLPPNDYYRGMGVKSFLALKSVLGDINNIFTLKVSLAFCEWVANRFELDDGVRQRLMSSVLSTKPNANGYDISIASPIALIAEVKCNVPINEGIVYGSAQRTGIEKDVTSLLQGKRKAAATADDCLKFMVFLDLPEIRSATHHLARTSKICKDKVVFIEDATRFDRHDVVYITYVRI